MAKRPVDVSADIDSLYQQPLSDFTESRNALAKRVKEEQGAEAAAAIKALQKPSIPAWVVNQLFWRDRREFDKVLKAGDRLRGAQQERLAGHGDADELREAIESRQQAIAALLDRARELMTGAGMQANPDMLQRVGTTIEALSTYGTSDAAPRVGRLVEEVAPPGLEALAALMPVGGLGSLGAPRPAAPPKTPAAPPLRVVDKARSEKAQKAKAAFDAADVAVARARQEAEAATAAQEAAEAAWADANKALQDVRRVLDEAMDREREAQHTRDTARRDATRATQALDRAERTRDAAEREYQSHS
jgi:hypothetical protein